MTADGTARPQGEARAPRKPARLAEGVYLHDLEPQVDDVAAEIRAGLAASPKCLPPKLFYDERGSELFERICEQPEYYLTRAEMEILSTQQARVRELLGDGAFLVEYGSGSTRKIRAVIDALRPAAYMPIDISRDHLAAAALDLAADYPELPIHAACADYSRPLTLPWRPQGASVAGFFPGSSIGNFEPAEARTFLAGVRETLGPGGRLLVGVDRRAHRAKDRRVVERAYDDAAGVTAAFNRNVLYHIRALLGGDLDPERFGHLVRYDEAAGRIEMYLVAREPMVARVGSMEVAFAAGERLHTENSYKYAPEEFEALADAAGFEVRERLVDAAALFSVYGLEAR